MKLNKASLVGFRFPRKMCGSWVASAFVLAAWCDYAYIARAQYTGNITIPKGYVQVEGDIIMTESNAAALFGPHREFGYAPTRLWPNRVVPYDFDPAVTPAQQSVFVAAMTSWQNSSPGTTTISFQPRNGEAGYLHLVVGDPGGYSGG